ncbi:hypothetical protein Ancab_007508, partial [Ancistrocladus abbreviatus]
EMKTNQMVILKIHDPCSCPSFCEYILPFDPASQARRRPTAATGALLVGEPSRTLATVDK